MKIKKQADELFTRLMEQCATFEKRYGPTVAQETTMAVPCHKCETPLDYLGSDDDGEIWWCVGCQAYRAALQ